MNRFRSCTPEAGGKPISGDPRLSSGDLDYNLITGGDDFDLNLSNSYCWIIATTSYVAVKGAICTMNKACGSGSCSPIPSPITDLASIAKASTKAFTNTSCAVPYAVASGVLGGFLATMKYAYYDIANDAYKNVTLCIRIL